jgi:hypothetical protein
MEVTLGPDWGAFSQMRGLAAAMPAVGWHDTQGACWGPPGGVAGEPAFMCMHVMRQAPQTLQVRRGASLPSADDHGCTSV